MPSARTVTVPFEPVRAKAIEPSATISSRVKGDVQLDRGEDVFVGRTHALDTHRGGCRRGHEDPVIGVEFDHGVDVRGVERPFIAVEERLEILSVLIRHVLGISLSW